MYMICGILYHTCVFCILDIYMCVYVHVIIYAHRLVYPWKYCCRNYLHLGQGTKFRSHRRPSKWHAKIDSIIITYYCTDMIEK